MIRRLLIFVFLTGLAVAGAVWLADRPGEVIIRWQGWRVDTTVPVLALVLGGALAVLGLAWRLIRAIVTGPSRLLSIWRDRRRRKGLDALTQGMNAVAAGDRRRAQSLARRADRLLGQGELSGVLAAQAARLGAGGPDMERRLAALADHPKTALMGLAGLLDLAVQAGDWDKAADFARRSWDLGGSSPDCALILIRALAGRGDWPGGLAILAEAKRRGALSGASLLEARAALSLGLALDERTPPAQALDAAQDAHRADPLWVPAAAHAALLLSRRGKDRKAQAILERVWTQDPHPDLARIWADLNGDEDPLARVKRVERLVKLMPDAASGHLALAQAALAARLWGQARSHAQTALALSPTVQAFQAMGRIVRDETGQDALEWAERAALAPLDEAWHCQECRTPQDRWRPVCPQCGAFNRLGWGR